MTDQHERADAASPEVGAETRIDLGAPAGKAPVAYGPRSAGGRALRTRDQAARRAEELRRRSTLVDAALEAGDLDRRRAGSLLAGGIAFRIFLWLNVDCVVMPTSVSKCHGSLRTLWRGRHNEPGRDPGSLGAADDPVA